MDVEFVGSLYVYSCGCTFDVVVPLDTARSGVPITCPVHICGIEHASDRYEIVGMEGPFYKVAHALELLKDSNEEG